MASKLTNCKVCGSEVAKSAKTCPYCGARVKKRHSLLIAILVILLVVVVIGSLGDGEQTEKEAEIAKNQPFRIGETAQIENIAVSMLGVTESVGSEFNQPADGNVFVLCEFEIANNSRKEITVSSMMSFEAYCDDYTCTYSLTALMEKGNKNQLDGAVAAGKKFNGVIGYEVPAGWQELEIRFTPDFWSGKDAAFVAMSGTDLQMPAVVPQKTEPAELSKPEESSGSDVIRSGETAEQNGVSVVLRDVITSTGSEYNRPAEGNVFVLCEFEIANDSAEEITVSSMMSFEAYCDDYTCTYSLNALVEKGSRNQLDGTVAAGKKFSGVIGYEVPADWQELEIHFTPDFWSGRDMVFLASNG